MSTTMTADEVRDAMRRIGRGHQTELGHATVSPGRGGSSSCRRHFNARYVLQDMAA